MTIQQLQQELAELEQDKSWTGELRKARVELTKSTIRQLKELEYSKQKQVSKLREGK